MTIGQLKALPVGTRVLCQTENLGGTIVYLSPVENKPINQTEIRWDDGTTMSLRILRDSMGFDIVPAV